MKTFLAAVLVATFAAAASAQSVSSQDLQKRTMQRRAVEAVIWGMPAVNFDLMAEATKKAGGDWNQVVYWSRPLTWKNQTLTPNPDTIYLMPFFNTREAGPVVMEIPPAGEGTITGSVDEGWQTAIDDVGPVGADKGKGGKYLVLPPDFIGAIPDGYIPLRSNTYQSYALLRSNLSGRSETEIARAVAYGKRVKVYPLSQASNPPTTKFVDAIDHLYDANIPFNLRFFESLHRFVQVEPWQERDKVMIDMLKSVGIEKGKPFGPDAGTKAVLQDAISEARAWIDAKYEAAFKPYFASSRWGLPASPEVIEGLSTNFSAPDKYPIDDRGLMYSIGYFSAKHLGAGQFYLMAIKDGNDQPLDGANNYVLRVPPNAPLDLYWSVTAYDRHSHGLIRNMVRASVASNAAGVQKNADGSADIYFGPTSPVGKESNWVPTDPQREFELMLRVYGPRKEFFEKKWVLPDIEKVAAQ